MLQASGAVKACDISRNIFCGQGLVSIDFVRIDIEIIVHMAAGKRFVSIGNLLLARRGFVSIKLCGRLRVCHKFEIARFFGEDIAKTFNHTALFARESAFATAADIAALQRNQHRLVDVTEIIGFHKNIGSHGGTNTVFGTAVEIVVPHVYGHGAYARMATIAVIEPVMMIRDKVFTAFAGHAAERHFAGIPEMIVSEGHIFGIAFAIERAVAFGLVGIATGLSVEKVDMMRPAMAVVAVDGNAVVHKVENAQVANFHTFTIAQQDAKPVETSIVANTFYGDIHRIMSAFTF